MCRLSPQEHAFDTAVRNWRDFDYRGRADLEHLQIPSLPIETLTVLRQNFNDALAVEGQHIIDHAPHPPFYLDYIDSNCLNALAFTDGAYSFIGVTIPLVNNVWIISSVLSAANNVVSGIGLPLTNNRELLHVVLFRFLLMFVVTHEYTHHVHGHLGGTVPAVDADEIVGGGLTGTLARQAREADADGYAAYFVLAYWIDSAEGRQQALSGLNIESVSPDLQDAILFSCFIVTATGFTFLRQPESLDRDTAYRRTHPPQSVRLNFLTWFVMKWCREFRPALSASMTRVRYQSLVDVVASVVWTGEHAAAWSAQVAFLRTADGAAYVQALIVEVDAFRAGLHGLGAAVGAEIAQH